MLNLRHCALLVFLSGLCSITHAKCTDSEVNHFENKWQETYNLNNPDAITQFYSKDAVFIGAFSHEPLLTQEARHTYFEKLFNHESQKYTISFDKKHNHIHILNGGAVSSGIYILKRTRHGQVTQTPIRFTMVFRDTPEHCELIVHHASFAVSK